MRQRFCQIRSRRIHILTISERGFAVSFRLSRSNTKKSRKGFLVRAMRVSLSFYANVFFFFFFFYARTRIFRARVRFLLLKKMDKFAQNHRKKNKKMSREEEEEEEKVEEKEEKEKQKRRATTIAPAPDDEQNPLRHRLPGIFLAAALRKAATDRREKASIARSRKGELDKTQKKVSSFLKFAARATEMTRTQKRINRGGY